MVRNALRKELAALLAAPPESRTPVIRRSLTDEWLYATDLPMLYGGSVPDTVKAALDSAGWKYDSDGAWLQLKKPAKEPPEGWYSGPFGPEAACCLSLLRRHPALAGTPSEAGQRMLIKAGEEGETAYEEACSAIHREWAERLRKGKKLPDLSRRYFGE